MSNFVDKIFSILDLRFNSHPSTENLLMTSDHRLVRIDNDLWQKSAVLRAHSISARPLKVLSAPKCTLMALIKAHKDGILPNEVHESYELLAAASELELGELKSKCFQNLCMINAFDGLVYIPFELSLDCVMRVFGVLVDSPLRTVDIYERQLHKIGRYCSYNRDVMTNVLKMLKQTLEKFKRINLEGIPADFHFRMLPVALYKRSGRLQTAVVVGTELRPVDLFGDRVDWEDLTGVSDFYLKYGQYLLYRSGDCVYYRDLQDRRPPTEKLSDCKIFLTRGNFVLVAHKNGPLNKISLWAADERFETIYQSHSEITILEFDCVTRVLAAQVMEQKLLLFKLENNNLHPLEERESSGVINVLLSDGNIFCVRESCEGAQMEVICQPLLCNEISRQCTDNKPDHGRFRLNSPDPTTWYSLIYSGGSYFRTNNNRLELATVSPFSEIVETLLTDGELLALSELWMSP